MRYDALSLNLTFRKVFLCIVHAFIKKKAIQHFQTDEMDSIEIEIHILHTVLLEI